MFEISSVLIIVSTICATVTAMPSDDLVVRTAQGRLRGSYLDTYTGKRFSAFRGIRYAESPSGDYRFKPPVPVKPWGEEIKNAVEDGAICPQAYATDIGPISSEDCLFLNVYSKQVSSTAKQPVMVFFHPGGYASMTGNSYWDGPQYLLEEDIVMVTINYRLGALGFACTEDSVLPGNYGMKDQVEALKWVHQNIQVFGGDENKVTIFGYSAGGASVTLHLVSPLSQGLFHRAIAMSGSLTSGWALNRRPKALVTRLANNLGCHTSDSSLIYTCLMQSSVEQIINATSAIKDFEFDPIALFAPVVEGGTDSDRFLPTDPLQLILSGQFAQVPIILGITRDEFSYIGYYVLQNKSLTNEFNQNFDHYSPIEFMYEREGARSLNISAEIKRFYLNNQPISNKTKTKFMEIYTDALTTFSVVQTAKVLASKSSQPVYLYLFNYRGRFSNRYYTGTTTPLGVLHHDDLIYLLYISKQFPEFNSTDPDAAMVRILTSTWAAFADTGVPETPCKSVLWLPMGKDESRYLKIDRCPMMVSGVPFPGRMAFWDCLFPVSGPHQEYY